MSCTNALASLQMYVQDAGYTLDNIKFAPASYRIEIACKVVPDIMKSTTQFACGNQVASIMGLQVSYHEDQSITWRDGISGYEKRCGGSYISPTSLFKRISDPSIQYMPNILDLQNMQRPILQFLPAGDVKSFQTDEDSLKWPWIALGLVAVLGTAYYISKD